LTGKVFDLLVALARGNGRLVGKDELLREVWPGVVVEEVNLSVNISVLRKLLGAAPDGKGWIETVPRRGYRFAAPVAIVEIPVGELIRQRAFPAADATPKTATDTRPTAYQAPAHRRRRCQQDPLAPDWRGGIALVALIAIGVLFASRRRSDRPRADLRPLPCCRSAAGVADDYVADGITEGLINV
jgi:DNA-binding winged helix-turn-helix (wHTH) protein